MQWVREEKGKRVVPTLKSVEPLSYSVSNQDKISPSRSRLPKPTGDRKSGGKEGGTVNAPFLETPVAQEKDQRKTSE